MTPTTTALMTATDVMNDTVTWDGATVTVTAPWGAVLVSWPAADAATATETVDGWLYDAADYGGF